MKRKKIAVVDDNIQIVEGIAGSIDWEQLGSPELFLFTDAQSVVEKAQGEEIDLVLSDICIPGMDGLQMAKTLLAQNPRTKIIFISGYADFRYAVEAVHMRAIDYVEKPVDYGKLFEILKSSMEQLDQEEYNAELLRRSIPIMRERFFLDLIHCSQEEARLKLADYAEFLNIDSQFSSFLCVSILVTDPEPAKSKLGAENWQIQMMILQDEARAHFSHFPLFYMFRDLESVYLILGSKNKEDKHFRNAVSLGLHQMVENYRCKLEFCCSMGDSVSSLSEIHQSYASSQNALNFRFFMNTKVFDMSKNLLKEAPNKFPLEKFREDLLLLICKKDKAGIQKFLNNQSQEISNHFTDKNLLLLSLFSVLKEIVDFIKDLGTDTEAVEAEISQGFCHSDRFSSVDAFFQWLAHLCSEFITGIDNSITAYHNQLCGLAVRYIKANFKDSSICLDDIAAHVNISPSYLSMIFKKIMGENITDMIANLRMEQAKNLLAYTTLPIKEISQNIGYSNQFYFSAIFKKQTGVSPSVYRENFPAEPE